LERSSLSNASLKRFNSKYFQKYLHAKHKLNDPKNIQKKIRKHTRKKNIKQIQQVEILEKLNRTTIIKLQKRISFMLYLLLLSYDSSLFFCFAQTNQLCILNPYCKQKGSSQSEMEIIKKKK
jgi:hypothetical protein